MRWQHLLVSATGYAMYDGQGTMLAKAGRPRSTPFAGEESQPSSRVAVAPGGPLVSLAENSVARKEKGGGGPAARKDKNAVDTASVKKGMAGKATDLFLPASPRKGKGDPNSAEPDAKIPLFEVSWYYEKLLNFRTIPAEEQTVLVSTIVFAVIGCILAVFICFYLAGSLMKYNPGPYSQVMIRTTRNCMIVVFCCVAFHTAQILGMYAGGKKTVSIQLGIFVLTIVYMIISLLNTMDEYLRHNLRMYDHSAAHQQDSHQIVMNVRNATDEISPLPDFSGSPELLYNWIWRPFYYLTIMTMLMALVMKDFDLSTEAYWIMIGYVVTTLIGSVLVGKYLGPSMFAVYLISSTKIFEEGDLITVHTKEMYDPSVIEMQCTGFVENIGPFVTTIRRFDMKRVIVPNEFFTKYVVANWKRPRKLIFHNFSVSAEAPVETLKIFEKGVLDIIKKHPQIDQGQYLKANLKNFSKDVQLQIVCFTRPGFQKRYVQRDMTLRVLGLAKGMGIRVVFNVHTEYQFTADVQKLEQPTDPKRFDMSSVPAEDAPPLPRRKYAPPDCIQFIVDRVIPASTSSDLFGLADPEEYGRMARSKKVKHITVQVRTGVRTAVTMAPELEDGELVFGAGGVCTLDWTGPIDLANLTVRVNAMPIGVCHVSLCHLKDQEMAALNLLSAQSRVVGQILLRMALPKKYDEIWLKEIPTKEDDKWMQELEEDEFSPLAQARSAERERERTEATKEIEDFDKRTDDF